MSTWAVPSRRSFTSSPLTPASFPVSTHLWPGLLNNKNIIFPSGICAVHKLLQNSVFSLNLALK